MARTTPRMHSLPIGNLRDAPAAFTPDLVGRIINFLPPSRPIEPAKRASVNASKIRQETLHGRTGNVIIDEFAFEITEAGKLAVDAEPTCDKEKTRKPSNERQLCPRVANGRAAGKRTDTHCRPQRKKVARRPINGVHGSDGLAEQPSRGRFSAPEPQTENVAADQRIERKTTVPVAALHANDWIGRRHQIRDAVIAFLKKRCILVTVIDRDALVRTYRISGKRYAYTLELVVEYAESLGFEVPA